MSSEIQTEHVMRWYLIYTKPACESVAQTNLERQGYRVYYPRLLRRVRIQGRWVERVSSLFPRYLFLHLRIGQQVIGPVRSTVGVAGIVRFGDDYAVVPDKVVENLRARANARSGLHALSDPTFLEPGARVRIVTGVFDGLEGVFQRESGDERVVVLLSLLGQEIPVRVASGSVLPLEAA